MTTPSRYRPHRVRLRDGRTVTMRSIVEADAPEIVQAFERLSADSRYSRFMGHTKQLDLSVLSFASSTAYGVRAMFTVAVDRSARQG